MLNRQNSLLQKMIEKEEQNDESDKENIELDFSTSEKQEARAFLRERFLRVITGIVGKFFRFFISSYILYNLNNYNEVQIDCIFRINTTFTIHRDNR